MKKTIKLTEARLLDIPLIVRRAEDEKQLNNPGQYFDTEILQLYEYCIKHSCPYTEEDLRNVMADRNLGHLILPRQDKVIKFLKELENYIPQIMYNIRDNKQAITRNYITNELEFFHKHHKTSYYFPSEVILGYLMIAISIGYDARLITECIKHFFKTKCPSIASSIPFYMQSILQWPGIPERLYELADGIIRKE